MISRDDPDDLCRRVQLHFDAAWTLRHWWRTGQPITAEQALLMWKSNPCQEDCGLALTLAQAEREARHEAGDGASQSYHWLLQRFDAQSVSEFVKAVQDAALPPRPLAGDFERHKRAILDSGKYKYVRPIGPHGAFGVVHLVQASANGKELAIKTPRLDRLDSDTAKRFRGEAWVLDGKTHDNVVCVHAHGLLAENLPYIEMEYVNGPSLQDRIEFHGSVPTPVPLREAVDLIRQAAKGLAFAHGLKVWHCDVKPSNILLERRPSTEPFPFGWRAAICDFGLARTPQHADRAGGFEGTPLFAAPELQVHRGKRTGKRQMSINPSRLDVFSLGIVAFRLLHGRHPFACPNDESDEATVENMKTCPPVTVSAGFPLVLRRQIARMLLKEPLDRPTMQSVVVAVEQALADLKPAVYQVRLPALPELPQAERASAPGAGDSAGADAGASKASEAYVRKVISVVHDQFDLLEPAFLKRVRGCIEESLRDPTVSGVWNISSCSTEDLAKCAVHSCNAVRLFGKLCGEVNKRNFDRRCVVAVRTLLSALLPLNADRRLLEKLRDDKANGLRFVEGAIGSATLAELMMAGLGESEAMFAVSDRASQLTGRHAIVWEAAPPQNPSSTGCDERQILLTAFDILAATADELDMRRPGLYRRVQMSRSTTLTAHKLAKLSVDAIRKEVLAIGNLVCENLGSSRRSFQRDCYCIVRLPDDDSILKSFLKKAVAKAVDAANALIVLEIASGVSNDQPDFSGLHFLLAEVADES